MAHKVRKHHARFFARTRPNKKSRKHPAQSMRDKEIFLRMKEKESAEGVAGSVSAEESGS